MTDLLSRSFRLPDGRTLIYRIWCAHGYTQTSLIIIYMHFFPPGQGCGLPSLVD